MERKKGIILSYILLILEIFSGLFITPLILNAFGKAEYGVYRLSLSIIAYVALLDVGVGNATVRYITKYRAQKCFLDERRFFTVAQIYYIFIAIIAGCCGYMLVTLFPSIFAISLSPSEITLGQQLLIISSINMCVTLITAVFPNILIGYGLFGISRITSIVQILLRITLTFCALSMGYKSLAIVSINVILTIFLRFSLALYVLFKLKIFPYFQGITKTFISSILGYTSWILVQMIATQINAMADQILLGIYISGAATIIAIYAVGTQIVQYFQSIGGIIGSVLMPTFVHMVDRGATSTELQKEMVRIGRISFILLAAIWGGFLLYGKQFIILWAGNSYKEAYLITALLMGAYFFIYLGSCGTQILWAKNEHKEQAILKFAIVISNIFITILLIQWNPLLGATIGTLTSLLLGDIVVMSFIFKKKIGINLLEYCGQLAKGLLPMSICSVCLNYLVYLLHFQGWTGLCVNVLLYIITYAILIYFFAMNPWEKQQVLGLLSKTYNIVSLNSKRN